MVAAMLWLVATMWNVPPTTLGEAAIREAVRRQSTPASTRVITDASLGPPPAPAGRAVVPDPSATDIPVPTADAKVVPPVEPAADAPVKDQAWWRARMTAAREAVARDRLLVTALESRVAALASDIASRDDPAQRAELMNARQLALKELERMKEQVESGTLAITTIEDEARKSGVPPGWIRGN
jgi:hypothetical protein